MAGKLSPRRARSMLRRAGTVMEIRRSRWQVDGLMRICFRTNVRAARQKRERRMSASDSSIKLDHDTQSNGDGVAVADPVLGENKTQPAAARRPRAGCPLPAATRTHARN